MFVILRFETSSLEGTTQGDPAPIYAIKIIPLLLIIIQVVSSTPENTSNMVAYVDDFTAGGKTKDFNHWWKFGY